MNDVSKFLLVICLIMVFEIVRSNDTLNINGSDRTFTGYTSISILEDSSNSLTIEDIKMPLVQAKFKRNSENKLNFEFSTSTYWLKLYLHNNSDSKGDYILEIANPDIDHLNFYELKGDSIIRRIETGELHTTDTRETYHRFFIFSIILEPEETGEYYIAVNNLGHSLTVPIALYPQHVFIQKNLMEEVFHWLIYGLLLFIIFFNFYLYRSTLDKVTLYNAFVMFFATALLLFYDNYIFFLNPPIFLEKSKWLLASFYTFFLITLTQAILKDNKKFKFIRRFLHPLKFLAVLTALFYPLKYPFSLVSDIGLPIIILISQIVLIIVAFALRDRKSNVSKLLVIAFVSVFLGLVVHELKEMNLLNLNFFVLNAIKIGLTTECILLTIAVLNRFRMNLEEANETIKESYKQIELQNKELEIINTELEKLSIVASETNNNIAIYDQDGNIEWCNSQFEKFYRTDLNDLIRSGTDAIESIVPNKNIRDFFNQCLISKAPVTFETFIRNDEDKEIWVQTTLTPLTRKNKVYRLIGIDSDISKLKDYETSLKLAKEKAIESDRLKTVFLGNMSHEIRTPLNGILGFSDLLAYTEVTEEKKQKYLKLITANGEQLLRIIDDIIDISLIESDQLKIHPAPFNLTQLLKGVIELFEIFKIKAEKEHIELILDNQIAPENSIVVSDPIRIKQILNNLIRNGLKFTKEGYVKLGCIKEELTLHFYIEDSGIGIEPSKKHVIFERFRQADERISREFGGTGLGLSISKGIVEIMKGRIWVDQEYDKGMRICFDIPISEPGKINTSLPSEKIEDSIPDIQLN